MFAGKDQRSQKFLAQPLAAHHVQILVAHTHRRHRDQRQRRARFRIQFRQKRAARRPILRLGDPLHFVVETRRRFLRGNDRAVVVHEIEKIELVGFAIRRARRSHRPTHPRSAGSDQSPCAPWAPRQRCPSRARATSCSARGQIRAGIAPAARRCADDSVRRTRGASPPSLPRRSNPRTAVAPA